MTFSKFLYTFRAAADIVSAKAGWYLPGTEQVCVEWLSRNKRIFAEYGCQARANRPHPAGTSLKSTRIRLLFAEALWSARGQSTPPAVGQSPARSGTSTAVRRPVRFSQPDDMSVEPNRTLRRPAMPSCSTAWRSPNEDTYGSTA